MDSENKKSFIPKAFNKSMGIILAISVLFIIVAAVIAYNMGNNNATIELEGEKITLEEIKQQITAYEQEQVEHQEKTAESKAEYEAKKQELDELSEEYREVKALVRRSDELSSQIKEIEQSLEQKDSEVSSLDAALSEKQSELELLTNSIVEKKEEPRVLSAGVFTVGTDLPAGRYKIEPNSGSGNYFVNSGMKTNIILGKGDSFYLSEYIMAFSDGDEIEATLPVKYTPVE
ncbi:hypothetical protein AB3N04_19245 [Alkalihalophilus sp. As8PL]|uniref:Uncharacterized protein n=1 Tax=Alkalihalophilus sp. As8PL TaxID=3237103 RepID=A0AB39BTW8_9BACI